MTNLKCGGRKLIASSRSLAEFSSCYDDGEEGEEDVFRRRKAGYKGNNSRNPNMNYCDGSSREHGRREGRGRMGSCWDPPSNPQPRNRLAGMDQQFDRLTTCWDPPHRFHSHVLGYEKPQRIKMLLRASMALRQKIGFQGLNIILII